LIKTKPEQVIDKIVKEGKLKDESIGTVTQWRIENEGKLASYTR
jgi:hypothetical protein